VNPAELLPLIRELFSRNLEYRHHQAWELQWILFSLNYTNMLEDEAAIEAARVVALTDETGEAA
jgi:hypothetical protein